MLSFSVSLPPKKDGGAPALVLHGDTHVQEQVGVGRCRLGRGRTTAKIVKVWASVHIDIRIDIQTWMSPLISNVHSKP